MNKPNIQKPRLISFDWLYTSVLRPRKSVLMLVGCFSNSKITQGCDLPIRLQYCSRIFFPSEHRETEQCVHVSVAASRCTRSSSVFAISRDNRKPRQKWPKSRHVSEKNHQNHGRITAKTRRKHGVLFYYIMPMLFYLSLHFCHLANKVEYIYIYLYLYIYIYIYI